MFAAFDACYRILNIPITVEGFTFTLLQMLVFTCVLYLLSKLLFGMFS